MSTMKRRAVTGGLLVVVLLGLAVMVQVSSRPAEAAGEAAALDTFTCTPTNVANFTARVHVRCAAAAPGNIVYFAACSAQDSTAASRYLSLFTTAFVMGKSLRIYYTPSDTSGTACGCQVSDCRVIWGAEVLP